MNKRLVVLIGLGVISFVGAVQLIEFKKHGPAGQSATGNQNSLGLKQTNSDSLPPGTPFVPEGSVTRQLDELKAGLRESLADQQQIFDSAGKMTADQETKLSERLARAHEVATRTFTRTQIKGMMQQLRGMLETPECPGIYNHVSPPRSPALLSWRVHFLPWIGHRSLYDEFHLQEPWDSPHNLALLEKIPPVYKLWDDDDSTTNTRLLAVDGSDTLGTEGRLRAMHAISDSESETLAIVVVSKELAVPWTQPIDFTLRADLFPQQMQKIGRDEFVFTTVQGAALTFPARGQFATFEALATIGGGEANAIDAMIKRSSLGCVGRSKPDSYFRKALRWIRTAKPGFGRASVLIPRHFRDQHSHGAGVCDARKHQSGSDKA